MAERSESNPNISDGHSPLQTLVHQALRRYGEFAADTIDGETAMMAIEFANAVIDEVRLHPYAPGTPIDYYVSLTDRRPVPDPVMVAGLLMHLAIQQQSEKVQFYLPSFHRALNVHLWYALNGNAPIGLRTFDGGTSTRHKTRTDPTNGRPL